jgi:hypothetical protein
MQFFDMLKMKMSLDNYDKWLTFAESEVKTDCGMTTWDGYSCLQTPTCSVMMTSEMNISCN